MASFDLRLKSRTARKGFSFTEILFAVMILGIGFIMVAAMFPVALQQTENSTQETIGSSLARTGVRQMEQVAKTVWPKNTSATAPYPTPDYSILVPTFCKRRLSESIASLGVMRSDPYTYVPTVASRPVPPLTITVPGQVWSCNDERNWYRDTTNNYNANEVLWSLVSHNMISIYDGRYAWVALYKRDRTATYPIDPAADPIINDVSSAQLFIFATQVRNTQAYNVDSPGNAIPSDTAIANPNNYTASLQATLTTIGILPAPKSSGLPAKITVDSNGKARVAEGAFIVISDDSLPSKDFLHGSLNGHIYRIGTQDMSDPTGNTWELAPGYSLTPAENDVTVPSMAVNGNAGFPAYIVGKGRDVENPGDPSKPNFAGPAQDISVYTTFIQVNP